MPKQNLITYAKARLNEPSTWSGVIKLATALAIYLQPDKTEQILGLGIAVNGVFNVTSQETRR